MKTIAMKRSIGIIVALLCGPIVAVRAVSSEVRGVTDARNLQTDEPRVFKGQPDGAADYVPQSRPTDGQHLALTMEKLSGGIDPPRPLLVWAIGSSYTNMLGNGELWKEEIARRFPEAPSIEYRKMVGNSCPWQYLRGWARHLVIPDQPDVILTYTNGKPEDLDALLTELRSQTTADILVPSIHWRKRDQELWGKSENATDQDVAAVRAVCQKHGVEFVENRRDWGAYLQANKLPISALLKDPTHQSDFGAAIINRNMLAHLQTPAAYAYDPRSRERRVDPPPPQDGVTTVDFVGTRIDLVGRKSPGGGSLRVLIDDRPAADLDAFLMSYVMPDAKNARVGRGSVPRDQAPHGITLGTGVVPQDWTIVMTSDTGDYALSGSATGPDGAGNAFQPFTSRSGQITIEPGLWRRAERNRTGDRFTFSVRLACANEIDFKGPESERFSVRVGQMLANGPHRLTLQPARPGPTAVEYFRVYEPPLKP